MKKFLNNILLLVLTGLLIYTVNDKYDLAGWIVELEGMKEMKQMNQMNQEESFANQVRIGMLEGEEQIILRYVGDVNNMEWFTEEAIDSTYHIDDSTTSSDYDYLRYKTKSIYSHISGLGKYMTVTYNFQYNESAAETEQVDQRINELFRDWKIDKLSDYDKIKKIHDFIINNASYDVNLEHYSAFENLINQRSTCQGYMMLVYKMMTEASIPCRIISGTGDGESHGWNIVKLEGKWYNLDCTWDDPLTRNGEEVLVHDYFLKSDEDFGEHVRDEEFRTEEFYGEYEMGEESYGE